jgi:serum/glucocorticoid-regulated kinase 2
MPLPSPSVPCVCVLLTFLAVLIWAYVTRHSLAFACRSMSSCIIANTAVPCAAPTHNLTLTRTATEVVELHAKLEDSDGASKLPKLPIDIASLPQQPTKRKSTFLNTLSRLASPSTSKVGRQMSVRAPSSPNFGASTADHIASPSQEICDPFMTLSQSSASIVSNGKSTNTTITALAAYLTTISNDPSLRQTRAWKRFVHVRTDDLESVRTERAIKRVRSDLAAHIRSKADVSAHPSSTDVSSSGLGEIVDGIESINDTVEGEVVSNDLSRSDLREADIKEEEELEANAPSSQSVAEHSQPIEIERSDDGTPDVPPADNAKAAQEHIDTDAVTNGAVEEEETTLPTPVADSPASRIPRSHSADPDRTRRLSRVYTSSTMQDGTSSATGDESSISTTARRARKKRSQSTDPSRKKKAQRKVAIDDFEMMRVLGKGCAGKVLLVRHKMSADLYALKAITKRHVLAHQELQHTLTEQAVLKRMAKESKDPFVVKLWWSFHDKENLFLVMVNQRSFYTAADCNATDAVPFQFP